jgi:hypothetical protein
MNVLYLKVKKWEFETRFLHRAYDDLTGYIDDDAETGRFYITLTRCSHIIGIDQPTANGGSYVR